MGERGGVATDRRFGIVGALLERPECVALGALPVTGEDARLEDRDRTPPASRRCIVPALAVAPTPEVEPLARFVHSSLHQQRQAGARGCVAETCQLPLP